MLEGFHLADQFCNIATDFRCHHFHGADIEVRVDQESSTDINAGSFIVYAIDRAYPSTRIREQREWYATFHHLGKFSFLPYLMREPAISADGEDFHTQGFQFIKFDGNCRQFSRSDKCEITGIEANNDPLSFVIRQLNILEPAIMERG